MAKKISRREFIQECGLATLGVFVIGEEIFLKRNIAQAAKDNWDAGNLHHLIPIVNHERIFIKTSFKSPLKKAPRLKIGQRYAEGIKSDTLGRFWQFDISGLEAGKEYELRIEDGAGGFLCDPWPLKTFPHPKSKVEHLRILAFT
ncbi:MAG: hypothetical protein ACPL5I_08045 [Thermodesulfobacteriota bacterium]